MMSMSIRTLVVLLCCILAIATADRSYAADGDPSQAAADLPIWIDDPQYGAPHGLADEVDVDELQMTTGVVAGVLEIAVDAGVVDQRLPGLDLVPGGRVPGAPAQPSAHHQLDGARLALLQPHQFLVRARRAVLIDDLLAGRPSSERIDRGDVERDDHNVDIISRSRIFHETLPDEWSSDGAVLPGLAEVPRSTRADILRSHPRFVAIGTALHPPRPASLGVHASQSCNHLPKPTLNHATADGSSSPSVPVDVR
jgi:hypothetical protein